MTRFVRLIPWLAGVAVVGGSLLGANRLLQTDAPPSPGAPPAGAAGAGVTVLGEVASDPPDSAVGPPAVAALATVAAVFVADGQAVKVGDKLVQFDDTIVKQKLPQAEAELLAAREDLAKAEAQRAGLKVQIDAQAAGIKLAEEAFAQAEASLGIAQRNFEQILGTTNLKTSRPYTDEEKAAARRDNLELRKAESEITTARIQLDRERAKLAGLKLTPVAADVNRAAAKVTGVTAAVAEAKAAIDAHLVTARVAGVVERVFAAPGMTYGPGTRVPLLHLVPAGKRVVRADVEAEFINRVSGSEGKPVTVVDATDFSLKYAGTVRLVGSAFLGKRSQADGLALHPVRVVEVVIDVADPAPPGKPPLRVGQPVRVTFP